MNLEKIGKVANCVFNIFDIADFTNQDIAVCLSIVLNQYKDKASKELSVDDDQIIDNIVKLVKLL